MPRTGEGEQQTRNKTKTKRHTGNAPRAQLRRARCSCVQFAAMSKAAEPRDSDRTKHQKTQNLALVSQLSAPRLRFMCAFDLSYEGESVAILRAPLRFD